eukprot:366444-Chlamydomonas_euryale.AAC.6
MMPWRRRKGYACGSPKAMKDRQAELPHTARSAAHADSSLIRWRVMTIVVDDGGHDSRESVDVCFPTSSYRPVPLKFSNTILCGRGNFASHGIPRRFAPRPPRPAARLGPSAALDRAALDRGLTEGPKRDSGIPAA